MRLRIYQEEDAAFICKWICSEEEMFKWSADRINRFPLLPKDINENYRVQLTSGRFFPISAVDDEGNVVGHFIIRYPKTDDESAVRFGFVVIDSNLRGKSYGKEMLLLGVEYVKEHFKVQRIELGVFEKNNNARYCYEAVGFREYSRRLCTMKIGTWECIDMELFL